MKRNLAATMLLLVLPFVAEAAKVGAHVHGEADLIIAVDGNQLQLELTSPLDSLLGFEHASRTEKQRKAAQALRERFARPETLFAPSAAARCTAAPAQLKAPVLDAAAGNKADGHAELEASIVFRCEAPDALKEVDVRLFDAFAPLHRVKAQVAGPRGQRGATLTPKRRVVSW